MLVVSPPLMFLSAVQVFLLLSQATNDVGQLVPPTLPPTIAATTTNATMIDIQEFRRRNLKIVFGVDVEGHFST